MKTTAKEIQEKLHKGIVTFTFEKKDGTLRTANGTLLTPVLEENNVVNKGGVSSPKVQVFFDLDKKMFRSFTIGTEKELLNFVANE